VDAGGGLEGPPAGQHRELGLPQAAAQVGRHGAGYVWGVMLPQIIRPQAVVWHWGRLCYVPATRTQGWG